MQKQTSLIIFILVTLIVLPGCTSVSSKKPEKITAQRIQQYINEQQLQDPLGISLITDHIGIAIYSGFFYEISNDQEGLMRSRKVVSSNLDGVMVLGSEEGAAYTVVAILDEGIQDHGEKLTVYFDNGVQVTKELAKQKAFAIPMKDSQTELYSIEIYDAEGTVIYKL